MPTRLMESAAISIAHASFSGRSATRRSRFSIGARHGRFGSMADLRVGIGIDAHAFADGVALVLGGVRFDHPRGLAGHSDGDVITHALIDALLGAAGLGDIGTLFPSDESTPAGIDSLELLRDVAG